MISTMLNSFKIKNYVQGQYELDGNLSPDDLFQLGVRINPKRSFLFVSKLLGKHLTVHPEVPRLTGLLLAHLYATNKGYPSPFTTDILLQWLKSPGTAPPFSRTYQWRLPKKVLFIGFCETATGLGHATFSVFKNASYLHTTREDLSDHLSSQFDFEEEHSHATGHAAYSLDPSLFEVDEIVLVDDEVTTGRTAMNLIHALQKRFNVPSCSVLSLLDWRDETTRAAHASCGVAFNALANGTFTLTQESPVVKADTPLQSCEVSQSVFTSFSEFRSADLPTLTFGDKRYSRYTGRFGLTPATGKKAEVFAAEIGKRLTKNRSQKKSLVIGHGEFIHFPSRVAAHMGQGIGYKSSTRSPILPIQELGYPIQDVACFETETGDRYFVYNLNQEAVKEVFYLYETPLTRTDCKQVAESFQNQGVEVIHFIKCD